MEPDFLSIKKSKAEKRKNLASERLVKNIILPYINIVCAY